MMNTKMLKLFDVVRGMTRLRFSVIFFSAIWASALCSASTEITQKLFENIEQEVVSFTGDAKARMYRERYDDLAFRLINLASIYPNAPRAPYALLAAAQLLDDLARTTKKKPDCQAAMRAYGQVDRLYSRSAAASLARVQLGIAKMRCGLVPPAPALSQGSSKKKPAAAADMIKPLASASPSAPPAIPLPPPTGVPAASMQERKTTDDSVALEVPKMAVKRFDKLTGEEQAKDLSALVDRVSQNLPRVKEMPAKKFRVVLDPGHGGMDSGAVGRHGGLEKDATLAIALKAKEFLNKEMPEVDVVMTRDSDVTVSLKERTELANQALADIYVSVHVNSNGNTEVKGIETYYLDLTSDNYAVRLAMRENAMSETEMSNLSFILADLATKAYTEDSKHLGDSIQDAVMEGLRRDWNDVRDLGVKSALLYVLLGVRMPSILIEASFISNSTEEKRLKSEKYLAAAARGIVKGIRKYLDQKKALYAIR
jgi:N-acetylmuramoyl-L-alanine amidase